jgi:uroporphyrinogen-III synthase
MSSKVYLVGAGGGNAGLITVRGSEVLRQASVVIHDALVGKDLLGLSPASAEKILSGDPSKDLAGEQREAVKLMIKKARENQRVVRLRGGDPYLYGSGGAEASELAAAGIEVEIVPGVSSFVSAPGYAGISDIVKRPLLGQRVVVTRSRDQAAALSGQLQQKGAEVLEIPVIKIVLPSNPQMLADALLELNAYDWIIFTSANGVTSFFDIFFRAFDDMRDIGGVRIAAVGPATAARLKELHLKVDLMPDQYVAAKVADALAGYESVENLKILLLRAEVATPELPEKLEKMGAIVDDIAVYQTAPETTDPDGAGADLIGRGADWVTFTSASTVENFHARFNLPELMGRHPRLRLASIGAETSKAIGALGLKPHAEAKDHTVEGLVKAVERGM